MNCNDLYPITVSKFESNILIDTVRSLTGTSERTEVSTKTQIEYLCNYLSEQTHVNAKTFLVENEYVDKYFLEDYSRYYSRCFNHVSKKCARIHFFSHVFDEITFIQAIEKNDQEVIDELKNNYLGFVVIRPISDTFIGRLCLKPYSYMLEDSSKACIPEYKIINSKQISNLFGIELSVQTTPFIEQDTVVSECATSVVWTLLSSGLSSASPNFLPSLSSVTEIASSSELDGSKTFPNGGLTYRQVCVALKYFDLEPNVVSYESIGNLKELVHAYVSSDIPIIIGGEILIKHEDSEGRNTGNYQIKGRHFACILGYHCNFDKTSKGNYLSHSIDKLYIHDDRIGPYVRLDLTAKNNVPIINSNPNSDSVEKPEELLEINLYGQEPQLIKPEILIIGLYHKIRLTYQTIKNFHLSYCAHLGYTANIQLEESIKQLNSSQGSRKKNLESKSDLEKIKSSILSLIEDSNWEITLTNNSEVKRKLSINGSFCTFNGSNEKSYFLIKSLPKYIWQIRFNKNGDEQLDILLDATSVPQSDTIIGIITYSKENDALCRFIESSIKQWRNFKFKQDEVFYKNNIKPLFRFYSNLANRSDLNGIFGPLSHPRRSPKKDETDDLGHYVGRNDLYVIDENFDFKKFDEFKTTNPSTRLIWVIAQSGEMIIGEDVKVEDSYAGHPTLTDGKAARVAGELIFSKNLDRWVINLESGTYSSHLDKASAKTDGYLNNVISKKLVKIKSEVENFYKLNTEDIEKYRKEFPLPQPHPK